jgi:hypothetical protein
MARCGVGLHPCTGVLLIQLLPCGRRWDAGRLAAPLRLPCLAAVWGRRWRTTRTPLCIAMRFDRPLTGCVACGAALPHWNPPVPVDARVLLLGDSAVWAPAGGDGHGSLWLHLRLLFCRAVWVCACRAKAEGGDGSWQAVVAMVHAWVSRAIRQDWLWVSASLPGAAVLPSWCAMDKCFQLTQDQFRDRWCINDILAHIDTDTSVAGRSALCVHVPGSWH